MPAALEATKNILREARRLKFQFPQVLYGCAQQSVLYVCVKSLYAKKGHDRRLSWCINILRRSGEKDNVSLAHQGPGRYLALLSLLILLPARTLFMQIRRRGKSTLSKRCSTLPNEMLN
jgi:hypothetical protein